MYRKIKMIRERRGISLQELAEKTGIPKSTLQRYETGTTKKIPQSAKLATKEGRRGVLRVLHTVSSFQKKSRLSPRKASALIISPFWTIIPCSKKFPFPCQKLYTVSLSLSIVKIVMGFGAKIHPFRRISLHFPFTEDGFCDILICSISLKTTEKAKEYHP